MNKTKSISRTAGLILVLAVLVMASIPSSNAFASEMDNQVPPLDTTHVKRPLAKIWKRSQRQYEQQGKRLERRERFITRIQERLDNAKLDGKDVTSVQAALDVFKAATADAHTIYKAGAVVISTHAGFDIDGKVLDRVEAVKSIESLRDVIRETGNAMRDPYRLLRDALRAFRKANQPAPSSTP